MNTELTQQENYWRAVLARDRNYDGTFVFAVNTTGIYCRPSCAAKRPKPQNVAFFQIPEAAAQAGFRACLRCRPDQADYRDPRVLLVRRVCRRIEQRLANLEPLTLIELSRDTGSSPFHLQRVFKNLLGVTPRQYAEALRLRQFKSQIKGGSTVTNAMYDAGYGSSSRLYEKAPSQLGMTPAAYRKGAAGLVIDYAIVNCPLGRLLVAATERGVCAVSLADNDPVLEKFLKAEFPDAEVRENGAVLKRHIEKLLQHLKGEEKALDLPLDVKATAFQLQVWNELKRIPYGSTRSYAEVARAIGKAGAVRAVARACATNPAALVIPCHRVVRSDRSLSGYRWGVERKAKLLQKEQKTARAK